MPISRELRINERIRVREVRVVDEDGQQLGILPLTGALELAREKGLDLVEVAPGAEPPVCRILDFGKFKYEQSKRDRESRKHQKQVVLREVRMKPKIDDHDIEFKTRTAAKLLREGDKVKVSVMFRGREVTHPEIGRELLQRIHESLKEFGTLEKNPSLEGRFMTMIMAPAHQQPAPAAKPKAEAPAKARPAATADGAAPEVAAPEATTEEQPAAKPKARVKTKDQPVAAAEPAAPAAESEEQPTGAVSAET